MDDLEGKCFVVKFGVEVLDLLEVMCVVLWCGIS